LRAGDVFWCTADPGWVTGTSYGIIAPLTNGITSVIDEGDFDNGHRQPCVSAFCGKTSGYVNELNAQSTPAASGMEAS